MNYEELQTNLAQDQQELAEYKNSPYYQNPATRDDEYVAVLEQLIARGQKLLNIQAMQREEEAKSPAIRAEQEAANRMEQRANMPAVERGLAAVKDTSLSMAASIPSAISNVALGATGTVARGLGAETVGRSLQTLNSGIQSALATEDPFEGYEGFIGGAGRAVKGFADFAVPAMGVGKLSGKLAAGLGELAKSWELGAKATSRITTGARLLGDTLGFGAMSLQNESDKIEAQRGKFSLGRSLTAAGADSLLMSVALMVGSGHGSTNDKAIEYGLSFLNGKGALKLTKEAFKNAMRGGLANGVLSGGLGTTIKEALALPDNPTDADYERIWEAVKENVPHAAVTGAALSAHSAVSEYKSAKDLYNTLGSTRAEKLSSLSRDSFDKSLRELGKEYPDMWTVAQTPEKIAEIQQRLISKIPSDLNSADRAPINDLIKDVGTMLHANANSASRLGKELIDGRSKADKEVTPTEKILENIKSAKKTISLLDEQIAKEKDLVAQQQLVRQKEAIIDNIEKYRSDMEHPYTFDDIVEAAFNGIGDDTTVKTLLAETQQIYGGKRFNGEEADGILEDIENTVNTTRQAETKDAGGRLANALDNVKKSKAVKDINTSMNQAQTGSSAIIVNPQGEALVPDMQGMNSQDIASLRKQMKATKNAENKEKAQKSFPEKTDSELGLNRALAVRGEMSPAVRRGENGVIYGEDETTPTPVLTSRTPSVELTDKTNKPRQLSGNNPQTPRLDYNDNGPNVIYNGYEGPIPPASTTGGSPSVKTKSAVKPSTKTESSAKPSANDSTPAQKAIKDIRSQGKYFSNLISHNVNKVIKDLRNPTKPMSSVKPKSSSDKIDFDGDINDLFIGVLGRTYNKAKSIGGNPSYEAGVLDEFLSRKLKIGTYDNLNKYTQEQLKELLNRVNNELKFDRDLGNSQRIATEVIKKYLEGKISDSPKQPVKTSVKSVKPTSETKSEAVKPTSETKQESMTTLAREEIEGTIKDLQKAIAIERGVVDANPRDRFSYDELNGLRELSENFRKELNSRTDIPQKEKVELNQKVNLIDILCNGLENLKRKNENSRQSTEVAPTISVTGKYKSDLAAMKQNFNDFAERKITKEQYDANLLALKDSYEKMLNNPNLSDTSKARLRLEIQQIKKFLNNDGPDKPDGTNGAKPSKGSKAVKASGKSSPAVKSGGNKAELVTEPTVGKAVPDKLRLTLADVDKEEDFYKLATSGKAYGMPETGVLVNAKIIDDAISKNAKNNPALSPKVVEEKEVDGHSKYYIEYLYDRFPINGHEALTVMKKITMAQVGLSDLPDEDILWKHDAFRLAKAAREQGKQIVLRAVYSNGMAVSRKKVSPTEKSHFLTEFTYKETAGLKPRKASHAEDTWVIDKEETDYLNRANSTMASTERVDGTPHIKGGDTKIDSKTMNLNADYVLVDADSVKTFDNTDYKYQDRKRAGNTASEMQINNISRGMKPYKIISTSPDAGNGLPVFDPEWNTLAGNGRITAIRQMYENYPEVAAEFKKYMRDHAKEFGLSPEEVDKMKKPIIGRKIRDGELKNDNDFMKFVSESNENEKLAFNASEKARSDARKIGDILGLFNASSKIESKENLNFINQFIKVTGANTGEMLQGGELSAEGKKRIENALIATVLGKNPRLVEKITNSTNEDVNRIRDSIYEVIGDSAKLTSEIKKGAYWDVDINGILSDSLQAYFDAIDIKRGSKEYNGVPITTVITDNLTNLKLSEPKAKVITLLSNLKSKTRTVSLLKYMNNALRDKGSPNQLSFDTQFDENGKPILNKPTEKDIVDEAIARFDAEYKTKFANLDAKALVSASNDGNLGLFRTNKKSSGSLPYSKEKIAAILKKNARLVRSGDIKTIVVDRLSDVPGFENLNLAKNERPQDVSYEENGVTYIVRENIPDGMSLETVSRHAIGAHLGAPKILGEKEYGKLCEYLANSKNKEIQSLADTILAEDSSVKLGSDKLGKEIFARVFEKGLNEPATLKGKLKQIWQDIKFFFKRGLRKLGYGGDVSEDELQAAMRYVYRKSLGKGITSFTQDIDRITGVEAEAINSTPMDKTPLYSSKNMGTDLIHDNRTKDKILKVSLLYNKNQSMEDIQNGKKPWGSGFEGAVYGRNGLAGALLTGSHNTTSPNVITKDRKSYRQLTAREMGRLMGYSDNDLDKIDGKLNDRQTQFVMGNSIVVPVAKSVIKDAFGAVGIKKKPTVISLFSGVGAFESGLDEMGGYKLARFSEINPNSIKAYTLMHGEPESKNVGDISKVKPESFPKNADLLTFGFPCQDLTPNGAKKGYWLEDGSYSRSGLFFAAADLIEKRQPKIAIAENSSNLMNPKFFNPFKERMEKAGYNVYAKILNAADFGVPQHRERTFAVCIRKDLDNGSFKFSEGNPKTERVPLNTILESDKGKKTVPLDKAKINAIHGENPLYRYEIKDGRASWTNERIDDIIKREDRSRNDWYYDRETKDWGRKWFDNSEAYAVRIDPKKFLDLTLTKRWQEYWEKSPETNEVRELNLEDLKNERQPMYLFINHNEAATDKGLKLFQVDSHEGRHRMMALAKAGITDVPVVVVDKARVYGKESVKRPRFVEQWNVSSEQGKGLPVYAKSEMVPIVEANREKIKELFGGPAEVLFRKSGPSEHVSAKTVEETYGKNKDGRKFEGIVKKALRANLAEFEEKNPGTFRTQKRPGYTVAALRSTYFTGYDMSKKKAEATLKQIKVFSRLKEAVTRYAEANLPSDIRSGILKKIINTNTREGVLAIVPEINTLNEKYIRQTAHTSFIHNMMDLKANKISTADTLLKLDVLRNHFTQEELDSLTKTDSFTKPDMIKMRNVAKIANQIFASMSDNTDLAKSDFQIMSEGARATAEKLNSIIENMNLGDSATIPTETLIEVNNMLHQIKVKSDLAKKQLVKDAKNKAFEAQEQIRKEMKPIDEKFANSKEGKSIGVFNNYLKPGSSLNVKDNDNFFRDMGPTMRKLGSENIRKGQAVMEHHLAKGNRVIDKIFEDFGGDRGLKEKFITKKTDGGHTYDLDMNDAMYISAMWNDRETRAVIRRKGKVAFELGEKPGSETIEFTVAELEKLDEQLSELQKNSIVAGKKLLFEYLPELNRVREKLEGVPFRTILDGTYAPRVHIGEGTETSSLGVLDAMSAPFIAEAKNADWIPEKKMRNKFAIPKFRLRGWTNVLETYKNHASLYIGMAEPLRELNRVYDRDMKRDIIQRYGKEYASRLEMIVRHEAGQAEKTPSDKNILQKYLSNIAAAKLTPLSAAKQFTSIPLASSIIDKKYLFKALAGGMSKENIEDMMSLDSMSIRYRDGITGVHETGARNLEERHALANISNSKFIKGALSLSLEADKRALGIIFKAAKLQSEAEGKGRERAVELFQKAVDRTQNTTDLANANGFQLMSRESTHWAFLNMYLNQTQKIPNEIMRLYRDVKEAEQSENKEGLPEAKGRLVDFIISVALMEAGQIGVTAAAASALGRKNDDTVQDVAVNAVTDLVGNPILKPAISGYNLQNVLNGRKPTTSNTFGNDISDLAPNVAYDFQQIKEGLENKDIRKTVESAIGSKAVQSALAMGKIPTFLANYPAQIIKNYFPKKKKRKQAPKKKDKSFLNKKFWDLLSVK